MERTRGREEQYGLRREWATDRNGDTAARRRRGFDEALGARPLKRSIQKLIEDPLSEHVLRGQLKEGSDVLVSRRGDELIFAS